MTVTASWAFPIALTWTSDEPIWIEQWPLKMESLAAAHQLVQEQFQQGHLRLSTSPWNTPIFVIKKKSGKFRLLQDLRAVNAQMQAMGALQPGLPNPAMLPKNWHLAIVDLKDCFFNILLHPKDTQRFAFTLPAVNREAPAQRFEWTVLPQGMKNSPTLCQLFVDNALRPVRDAWPTAFIYHYMDDILIAQESEFTEQQLQFLYTQLEKRGLIIAQEKVQKKAPWIYLGWKITESQIHPQKLQVTTEIKTLNDIQKLMGDLQWLRSVVGITNGQLEVLRPLLKGTDPTTPVTLSSEQRSMLQQLSDQVVSRFCFRRDPDYPIDFSIFQTADHLIGALTQCKNKKGEQEEVTVLEWVFPRLQPRKSIQPKIEILAELIKKGRKRVLQVTGQEVETVYVPMTKDTIEWYIQNSEELQDSLLSSATIILLWPLKTVLIQWIGHNEWMQKPLRSESPLENAQTVFTDAGKKSGRAAITWNADGEWHHHLLAAVPGDSLQTLELAAVVWAMGTWNDEAVNVVTDSLYVAGVMQRIEDSQIKDIKNQRLGELFRQLHTLVQGREKPYSVIHIRSHMWNCGLGEGNARADELVAVCSAPVSDFAKARESHSMFHQNSKGLRNQFNVTVEEARGIVRACPQCSHHGVGLGIGVNPRGLGPNEIWQMDVTHVSEFGRLKYLHVTIDTYSHFVWVTPQTGERAMHVVRHLTTCFAVMGVPVQIKTDNGPAYISDKLRRFCQSWGVQHVTGIPHSPTGQAIVERMNQTLKQYLQKFKEVTDIQERISKTLFVLNYLCVFGSANEPPVKVHSGVTKRAPVQMRVMYRNPETGQWEGPAEVQYVGRGYMCVLTPTGSRWIPAKWIRPAMKD